MSMRIRVPLCAVLLLAMVAGSSPAFCDKTWDAGGSDDNWSTAANWSTDTLPGVSDIAYISNPGDTVFIDVNVTVKTIRVENGATVTIQSGKILLQAEDSVVNPGSTLVIDGGTFQGVGTLHLVGTVDIKGGTLDGTGPLIIYTGGVLQFWGSTNDSNLLRTTFNNAGTINFLNTIQPTLFFRVGTNIVNGGVIDIQTDRNVEVHSGSPVLTNNSGGVIKKSAGTGSAAIQFSVNNNAGATIEASSGTLTLNGSGAVQGAYSISSGATLNLVGGTFTTSGNPTLTGPGTLSIAGGGLAINAGTFTMSGNPTVSGPISIAGGTLDAGAGVDVTWTSLALSSGTITGAGTVRVALTFTWSGGTIAGGGARVLEPTSTPTISCSAICTLDGAALQLQASATFSAGANALVFSNGASLTIASGKTFSITNGGDFSSGVGGGSIVNDGTIRKQTTSLTSTIGVPVTLSGTSTVDIAAGKLQFGGGATVTGATLDIAAGAGRTLEVTGGVFEFSSGASIFTPSGGTFTVSAGTLRVPTGVIQAIPNLTLQGLGSVIDGGGTLILSGTSTWTSGTMGSATAPGGVTQINSGNTLNISSGPQSLTQTRQLLNNGTVIYSDFGGAGVLTMSTNSKITNNGALNLINSGNVDNSPAGSALVENNGTLTIGGVASAFSPRIENNNGATMSLTGSGINVNGGAIFGGALAISSGATLNLFAGTYTVTSTATVTGAGLLFVGNATLDVGSGVNLTCPNLHLVVGTITGAGTLHVSGTFDWVSGTIAGSGPRVIDSTSTPTISCVSCQLNGAALQLQASATFSGSGLVLSNGASLTIDSGKTLSITNDGTITSGAGGGSIVNNGTILKNTAAGTSTIGVPVTIPAASTIDIDAGTLRFGGGADAAAGATVDIGGGTTLEVTGGVFLFSSGSVSMPGSGIFKVSSGTLRVPTGITTTIPNLTLQGNTAVIDGGGTLILSGTSIWTRGTMGSAIAPGGITQISSGETLSISPVGGRTLTQSRQLLNNGTVNYSTAAGGDLILSGNSKITNNGALNLTSDGVISVIGTALIENNGTITKNAGTGTSSLVPRVENNTGGTVSAATGTLAVSGGIAAGGYTISSGATLAILSGTVTVASTATITGAGTLSVGTGGILDAGAGVDLTIPNLTISVTGGIIGPGTVRVSGNFTWSGGIIGGSGARVLNSTSVPAFTCPTSCTLDGAALQLQASATYSGSGTALQFFNGASLTIDPGKVLQITNDGSFFNLGGGANSIINNGTIWKITTFGTSIIGVPVTLSGSLEVDTGTLQLGADVSVAAGAILDYTPGATIEVIAGVFLFNSSSVSILPVSFPGNGDFEVSGGTLRVPTGITITMPNVTLQGSGVIDGGGTLNLSGTSAWSGGTMSGSGTTIIPATMSLGISAPVTLNRTLQNDGTLTVSGDITGSGTIDNDGTLNPVGNITIGVTVNNSGQIVTSNALSLAGGGTHTGSFTVTTPGNLSFSSGTYSVTGGGSIGGTGTLSFSGATATVGVPINVGTLNVSAGTATLDANGSADAFTMTGGTLGGSGTLTLTNGGTWSSGTMSGSGTTVNPATMSLGISAPVTLDSRTLQNDGTLSVSGDITGTGTIDNGGTLNAVADLIIGAVLNNSGQVVTNNALSLAGGGTHTGSFTITTPGNLSFSSGTHSLSGGGSMTGTGTLTFSGATATVGVPVNVGALNVTAGTATLDANGSADAFTMNGGTLGGTGTLTLNNGGTWSGGTMSGSGTTVNPAAKTLSISGPVTLNSRTLQNDGTLSVSGDVAGSGTIANNGTLNAVGNITIGAAVNNSGQIATSELLSLGGNGAHNGTFTATAPGVIDFSGGTQTISGTLAGTGTVRFSGAAATVSGTWSGMPIEVAGGSVALDTNGTMPALTLSGGTLSGSGDVTVSGPSTWSGGTLAGSGDFTFDTGATVTMPGTSAVTLSRPLQNNGTINFTAASNGMHIAGATVRNDGTFDIQSSQAITAIAGTPPFLNRGTLKKSSGSGVMQFGARLSNSGLVRIESGTMQFVRTYTQSAGTTTILSGATLRTATVSLNGGSLTGKGTVAGTVDNHAMVSPGTSPGTLTINGDYVQSPDGTLEIQLGGTAPGTQYDRLLVSGSVTLGGTLDVTTSNGFTPTAGNAFQIITFGSRTGNSTFAVMNGLTGSGTALVPTFSATDLQLVSTVIAPVAADVAVGVTGPASTVAGTKVIYTVTVSNSGPDTATNIAVTATASPGLTFSANSGACVGSFPCNITTLGPGQSATIHGAWDVSPSAPGSVQLTVIATSAADANSSNNSDTAVTNIGTCPAITIVAPSEMTTGLTAEATATAFGGATYRWSIVNGTIDRGDGTAGIEFTAGEPGTTSLALNVTGGGCTLSATFDVTIQPRCVGTARPTAPADGTVTADAVIDFAWSVIDDASGYRLWLQQDGAPPQNLGTALGTSRTRIIPPGVYQWYVETLFDGCASHESERRALTILPGQDCASREKPQLTAPANETPATSAAVAFSWNAVDQALEYELWLASAGGVPTLVRTTSDTAYTAVVPPGRLEWYVRAIFAGCAATESVHRAFTCTPPPECTRERPLLIAPVEGERLTSPVSFEWTRVSGATSYELYVDGMLAATTTAPHASDLPLPRAERRWQVRARLTEGCGAVDSAESRMVVIPPPPSCAPLGAPVLIAPGQISSGIGGRIQWSFVAGATAYEVEISGDPRFPRESTSSSTVTARQLPITFTNQGSEPVARYVRVHAVDTNCVQPGSGAFSPVAVLSVLPPAASKGAALLTDPADVPYTLDIAAELAGRSFTATPTVPWISVTPRSGIVPPGGQTLRALAHTAGLPPGTSTGRVDITTTAADGGLTPLATPALPVNLVGGASTAPKSTPPPDALIIPAVASVTNFTVRYHSDVCVTNTSAQVMRYEINFVPTGKKGMSKGQKTNVSLEPGATMAINDIVATWFGGQSSTGTLEIRPLTETGTSTSSAPVGRVTFASSRTYSTTAAGGTYGQYVPAVPYANFIAMGSTLSLQHIAQSDKYRTNLGLVEGSGEDVLLEVRIFDADGTRRAAFPVPLEGGERQQLDSVLQRHKLALDDGRIEVEVISGAGKVTAYASVLDNATNDPQLVPPVTLDHAGRSQWVLLGVADLVSGSGNWQTDVRIFNAGTEAADLTLTLAFYSMNGGPATTRTITLAAGEVRQFDRVLSLFAISGDAGALHISSAAPAQIVATARTYKQTDDGAYGQFINAVTPDEAVAADSRPLQILQLEESKQFRSNIGFAEVSGKPVTLEVSVFRPNSNDATVLEVKLEPNQFRQMNSLLSSLGMGEVYNARISVRVLSGEGQALAYCSLIDHKTGDPTYIPGQ